jgi:D-alanyl-D-alanine carboxypeptidase
MTLKTIILLFPEFWTPKLRLKGNLALVLLTLMTLIVGASSHAIAPAPSLQYIAKNSSIAGRDPVSYMAVMDTSNNYIQDYRGDAVPLSLASVVKIFTALAILDDINNGLYTIDSPSSRPSYTYADGAYGSTVRENLIQMLGPSSNNAANILTAKAGGLNAVTNKIKKYGINNTQVTCYISIQTINSSTCSNKNTSTMKDLVLGMNAIRQNTSSTAVAMKQMMANTEYTYNHTNRLYNKCGLNSKSLGDVGVISLTRQGVTTEFVYAIIVDFPSGNGAYYADKTEPIGKPDTNLNSKRDPISKAVQWLINDLNDGFQLVNRAY